MWFLDKLIENKINSIVQGKLAKIIDKKIQERLDKISKIDPPKIRKLKIGSNKKEVTIWDLFLTNNYNDIFVCVRWADENGIEEFSSYKQKNIHTLLDTLSNFKLEYPQFSSFSIHVKPRNMSQSIIESLAPTSVAYYNSDEIPKLIQPVIDWLESKHELFI